jgi:hypothetical protein
LIGNQVLPYEGIAGGGFEISFEVGGGALLWEASIPNQRPWAERTGRDIPTGVVGGNTRFEIGGADVLKTIRLVVGAKDVCVVHFAESDKG